MKKIFGVLFLFYMSSLTAQVSTDLKLAHALNVESVKSINAKNKRAYTTLTGGKRKISRYNPITLVFSSMMYIYQNGISSQINAACLYHPSCSEFSKKCIVQHGLIRGILFTADRLQRCNRISALEFKQKEFDSSYRVNDQPALYK